MTDKPLAGKVALITGASAGLGKHFATFLAAQGAQTILAARRLEKLEETAAPIRAAGGIAHCVTLDVMESTQIPAAFDQAEGALIYSSTFGTVNILINNSGIAVAGKLPNVSEDDWDSVIGTNLKGAWMMAQEAARRMIAAETQGSIVNLASVLAFRTQKGVAAFQSIRFRKSRSCTDDAGHGGRVGAARYSGERPSAGLHRDRYEQRFPVLQSRTGDDAASPAGPLW